MSDLPNGFTGFSRSQSGFVSAGEAIRRSSQDASRSDASCVGRRSNADARPRQAYGSSADDGRVSGIWGARRPSSTIDMRRFMTEQPGGALSFDPDKLAQIGEVDRRCAWVEVDLSQFRRNCVAVRSRVQRGVRMMAVVKADAYGHGAARCAKMALNSGAEYLGVATVDEGIELREALINAPVLVLSEPPIASIPLLLAYKIMPSVYSAEFAIQYAEAADSIGLRAPFHLKVNTGMNRIGVRYDEIVPFMHQVGFHRALDLVGTYTSFATSADSETLDFHIQAKRFAEAVNALRAANISPGIVHAADSAATIRYPEVHCDMVRVGSALFGFHPCPETYPLIDLAPAMSVHARIVDARVVPMSEGVGRGLRYRSPGSVRICTVPVGYGDGLRRALSGNVEFIVDGMAFRQVGEISMDQCMFEVDMRSYGTRRRVDPQIGDEVIIAGVAGDAVASLDDMAAKLGCDPTELTIGFGCSRLSRIYR